MLGKTQRIRVLALFLGIVFLGAQFHFCADLKTTPSASHICPICSVVGSVVSTQSASITILTLIKRLQAAPLLVTLVSAVPRAASPRAPPSL